MVLRVITTVISRRHALSRAAAVPVGYSHGEDGSPSGISLSPPYVRNACGIAHCERLFLIHRAGLSYNLAECSGPTMVVLELRLPINFSLLSGILRSYYSKLARHSLESSANHCPYFLSALLNLYCCPGEGSGVGVTATGKI